MKNSQHRIITTHAGSLPRPDDLIELTRARQEGETNDEAGYQAQLAAAVRDVVRRQRECGIDIAGDGEYGKGMGQRINYGAWWSYSFQRLGGLRLGDYMYRMPPQSARGGRDRADRLPGPARPQPVSHRLCRSRFRRVVQSRRSRHAAAGLRGQADLYRPRRDRRRHRAFQGGVAGGRRRGRLHDLDRAGQLLAHRQRVLQDRGRIHLRLRRRDARGVQGDHRCRAGAAARRSVDRRELGPDQSGADGGGVSQVHA